jgi:hypothetical protein
MPGSDAAVGAAVLVAARSVPRRRCISITA